jgi:hypothetical protein
VVKSVCPIVFNAKPAENAENAEKGLGLTTRNAKNAERAKPWIGLPCLGVSVTKIRNDSQKPTEPNLLGFFL